MSHGRDDKVSARRSTRFHVTKILKSHLAKSLVGSFHGFATCINMYMAHSMLNNKTMSFKACLDANLNYDGLLYHFDLLFTPCVI